MAFGAESVAPRSVAVGTLLQEHHPFFVPRYQRSYAWEDQVTAFTDDVKDLISGDPQVASHFFGGLVCIEHTDHTQPRPHKYEIVDGQQRLATIVLTLAQIYRAALSVKKDATEHGDGRAAASADTLATDTRDRFLEWRNANVSAGITESLPRLSLSRADDDFYQRLVAGEEMQPDRESHELLAAAEAHIRTALINRALQAHTYQDKVAALERMRTAIVAQSHVIQIVSSDRDRAYQLFSVLNDRGRSLEDADLLRSYTLEMVHRFPKHQGKVAELWDKILSAPSKEVSDFFLAYYPSTTGTRTGLPIFKKLRDEYFPNPEASNESEAKSVINKVNEFREEMELFLKIRKGEWPYKSQPTPGVTPTITAWHKDRLRRLVISLKHELAMPLLLSAARTVDEKKFAELVYMLEIFSFRYKNVCGGHATTPAKRYYIEAKNVRGSKAQNKTVSWGGLRSDLKALIEKSAPDAQFKSSLESRLRYDYGGAQRSNIRELLTTLEEHSTWLKKGGTGQPKPDTIMVFDLERVTIEHIHPQKPAPSDSDPQLDTVCHHLGNLTFFGPDENSKAGNKNFASKKETYYAPSRVGMTSDLTGYNQWSIGEYEKRRDNLLEDACKVFTLG
ncbi:DUF262 domain-containing protein [Streptomyces griseus]|uniref:DUF262 domain-containing protein n=1 Tax=Streptomyces griseus TaxID=1911 RepID=UPI0036789188